MKTAFKKITYDMKIENPRSRVLKQMNDWTTIQQVQPRFSNSPLVQKKSKAVWKQEIIIAKLKPDALKEYITNTLPLVNDSRAQRC